MLAQFCFTTKLSSREEMLKVLNHASAFTSTYPKAIAVFKNPKI